MSRTVESSYCNLRLTGLNYLTDYLQLIASPLSQYDQSHGVAVLDWEVRLSTSVPMYTYSPTSAPMEALSDPLFNYSTHTPNQPTTRPASHIIQQASRKSSQSPNQIVIGRPL